MKHRIANWASAGFVVACCWVSYTLLAPPEFLQMSLRQPAVEALAFISCPVAYAGRHFPLYFWWVPPVNAATYAVAGLIAEALRRMASPKTIVDC